MKNLSISLLFLFISSFANGQSIKKLDKITKDANEAKAAFLETDPHLQTLFESSHGYVIFPNIGKGGLGVGGATGNGVVWEKGQLVGYAKMTQLTLGFQAGGQGYSEVIFFQNKEAFDRFTSNKIEFGAEVSAVAIKPQASVGAKYLNGVLVFTQSKGGLMYEASLGGQKFSYTPK
jgi:lipid-binding SYLF domain-containing protein